MDNLDDYVLSEENIQTEAEPLTPVDAQITVRLHDKNMFADVYVRPPENEGKPVTVEAVLSALKEKGVVHGIDQDMVERLVSTKTYELPITIAKGTPSVNSEDGKIIYRIVTERKIQYTKDGSIDYKNLNIIQNVKENQVICDIVYAEQPVDGLTILGEPVYGLKGKSPTIPMGKNTHLTEDKQQLVASCEGNVVFRKGLVDIEKIYEVHGNVDNSVGNIDFLGSVIVRGNVLEGYHIKAKSTIQILGTVEGATIISDGDITISNGINGMGKGIIQSGGEIKSKFFENCTITSKGKITADSMINCTVFCDSEVEVSGRRGAIIGGSYTVLKTIQAMTIGSPSSISTNITLGSSPRLIQKKEDLEQKLAKLKKDFEELTANINYLERFGKSNDRYQLFSKLGDLRKQSPILMLQISQATKQYNDTISRISNIEESRLKCNLVLYAGTRITIGNATTMITKNTDRCMLYYSDGEIKYGHI